MFLIPFCRSTVVHGGLPRTLIDQLLNTAQDETLVLQPVLNLRLQHLPFAFLFVLQIVHRVHLFVELRTFFPQVEAVEFGVFVAVMVMAIGDTKKSRLQQTQ
mgnify:CR=1 FL=1